MEHARPAQLIVAPRLVPRCARGRAAQAALGVVPSLSAARSADHVRAAALDVALSRPDVRPSRGQANPPPTVSAGTHYHYFRGTGYGR